MLAVNETNEAFALTPHSVIPAKAERATISLQQASIDADATG
jgi:hypothetical protein